MLVGAGIMSATLAILLREAAPELAVRVIERLEGVALESTGAAALITCSSSTSRSTAGSLGAVIAANAALVGASTV